MAYVFTNDIASATFSPDEDPLIRAHLKAALQECPDYTDTQMVVSGTDDARVIKYANGQMEIDMRVVLGSTPVTATSGSLYASGALALGNFPVAFIAPPIIETPYVSSTAGTQLIPACITLPTISALPSIAINRTGGITLPDLTVHIIAKGRWK